MQIHRIAAGSQPVLQADLHCQGLSFGHAATVGAITAADSSTCEKILRLFKAWDANGDGIVSRRELERLMRFVTDGKLTNEQLEVMMTAADKNRNGVIELEEFVRWIYNTKTKQFTRDMQPSAILTSKSPGLVAALQDWFVLFDMNHSGSVEYEELAVARLLLQQDVGLAKIDDEYKSLNVDGLPGVAWPEFFREFGRLLDGVPRPIEDKITMVRKRARKLEEAVHTNLKASCGRLITSAAEFMELLCKKYGSSTEALSALEECSSGVLTIIDLWALVEQLLDLPAGTRAALPCVRALFRELDAQNVGRIDIKNIEKAAASSVVRRHSRASGDNVATASIGAVINKPPLDEVVRFIIWLLARNHIVRRKKILRLRISNAKATGDDKAVSQLETQLAELEASDSKHGNKIWILDAIDAKRVTPTEFRMMIETCLAEELDAGGRTVAVQTKLQTALQGWSVRDIFAAIDKNNDGFISVTEWGQWLRDGS